MQNRVSQLQIIIGLIFGVLFIIACSWMLPMYNVYKQKMNGEASFQRAQKDREIRVLESKAKMEAAQYEYQADTIRAKGIARSNEIIGSSLNQNEAYLKWLWIDELHKSKSVIYIPTENGMPIMEAQRLKGK